MTAQETEQDVSMDTFINHHRKVIKITGGGETRPQTKGNKNDY